MESLLPQLAGTQPQGTTYLQGRLGNWIQAEKRAGAKVLRQVPEGIHRAERRVAGGPMVRTGALYEGAWEGFEQAHRSHSRREGFCGARSTQKAPVQSQADTRMGFGGGGAGGSFLGPEGRGEEARSPAGTCEQLWAGEGVPEAQERLSAGMMGQT